MLDLTRFLFAILVVIEHLSGRDWALHFGRYGVWGFYVMSGYLMTMVCRRTYRFSVKGTKSYFLNRFLRIYPTYYLAVAATAVVVFFLGGHVILSYGHLSLPSTTREYLSYILIVPWIYNAGAGLVPPEYSLGIEVVHYFTVFFLLARSFRLTWLIMAASVLYTVSLLWRNAGIDFRYLDPKACLLPFAIGALLWFLEEKGSLRRFGPGTFLGALAAFFLNLGLVTQLPLEVRMTGPFYVNLLIVTCLVVSAPHVKIPDSRWKAITKYLGKLSYPIFLVHMMCGVLVAYVILGTKAPGLVVVLITLPIAFLFSALIVHFVDEPMNAMRDIVKEALRRKQAPAAVSSPISV
jgi:peptidoglycan/LPS O-acetylase OafA/YrhL